MTLASLPSAHFKATAIDLLSETQQAARHENEQALEEFLAADTIVLGVPMYNFGVAAQLKSWIDAIMIPGKTFYFTSDGPIGLADSKRVIAAIGRGSYYGPGQFPLHAEHAETYIRSAFSFMGVNNLEMVIAEGIALDKGAALRSALQAAQSLPI
jgi:FMN-dependent NADH-azoreductase